MQTENIGDYIRQLREQAEMPLRKLAALLDIDQSTLSKLERGERPVSRQMLPIIAKTFKVDEKELVIKFMSKQIAYQLADEKYSKDILANMENDQLLYFIRNLNLPKKYKEVIKDFLVTNNDEIIKEIQEAQKSIYCSIPESFQYLSQKCIEAKS